MRKSIRQRLTRPCTLGLLLGLLGLAGCSGARYLTWLVTDPEEQTVQPEFPGLEGKSLAVLIYVEDSVLFDYPNARQTLGAQVATQIEENVEDCTVVTPSAVARYQDENLHWDTRDRTRIAKDLKVDYVCVLTLLEYTLRQPGQMNAYQGRIIGEARLFDAAKPEDDCLVWRTEDPIEVVYPDEARYSRNFLGKIHLTTERNFAETFAKKFYKHTIVVEPHESN